MPKNMKMLMINLFLLAEKYDNKIIHILEEECSNMSDEEFQKYQDHNDYLNNLPHEPSNLYFYVLLH